MTSIPPLDYQKELYFEKSLKSVANATRQDGVEFLKIASEIPVDADVQIYPLEKASEALLDVKQSRIKGTAVLKIS
jgi:Zn-dependent alcohol dehydrogenases